MSGIEKLLKACEGSPTAAAQRLSTAARTCSRQIVEYWIRQGYVSGTWAPHVNSVFGIPLHELNPKIYPDPSPGPALRSASQPA